MCVDVEIGRRHEEAVVAQFDVIFIVALRRILKNINPE
jgi:hypothetical protein